MTRTGTFGKLLPPHTNWPALSAGVNKGRDNMGGRNIAVEIMKLGTAIRFLIICVSISIGGVAQAQTTPAFRFGEAPLVGPYAEEVQDAYEETGHTDGYGSGRSEEIRSLARGLNYDADLIFEYVYENIDYYPTFGLAQGALGAHLNKSGTAFDQAQLMLELLDEAKNNGADISNIRIQYGTLELNNSSDIIDWLGVSDARALCRLLANGGIPGRVNGSADTNLTLCSNAIFSGSMNSLVIAHAWVTATVDGTSRTYDPSYKHYETIAPMSFGGKTFRTAMSGSCGGALSAGAPSQTSTNSGVPFAKAFNTNGLQSYLDDCAEDLWDWIETNKPEASVEDIIGGRRIKRRTPGIYALSGNRSVRDIWTKIPDPYRMKFTVNLRFNGVVYNGEEEEYEGTTTNYDIILFADEITGKRIALEPNGFDGTGIPPGIGTLTQIPMCSGGSQKFPYKLWLTIDGEPVSGVGIESLCIPHQRAAFTTVTVDAPYAAEDGAYLDTSFGGAGMDLMTRAVMAFGVGRHGPDGSRHYGRKMGLDRSVHMFFACINLSNIDCVPVSGDGEPEVDPSHDRNDRVAENVRFQVFSAWFEQFSRMGAMAAQIHDTVFQHHYTVGWAFGETRVRKATETPSRGCNPCGNPGDFDNYFFIHDDALLVSMETAVSTTLSGTEAAPVRRSIAAAAAALESSVMAQQLGSTAPGGSAQKFAWANTTLAEKNAELQTPINVFETSPGPQTGQFPFYHYASASDDFTIITSNGYVDCVNVVSSNAPDYCLEKGLRGEIQKYLNAGYIVVAAGDAYLGPGMRCGEIRFDTTFPNPVTVPLCNAHNARGGAFIAFKPDFSDIAHMSYAGGRFSKGGAAGVATPDELALVDIPTPADLLKEEEENSFAHTADLRSGSLSLPSGDLITAGTGAFPYSLPFSRNFQGGDKAPTEPLWSHNWHMPLSISGSGNEAMGASRGLFAAGSIAYLVALDGIYGASGSGATHLIKQETIGALTSVWWTDGFNENTVSATFGGQTVQFFRKPDTNTFYPTEGGAARLTQSGSAYKGYPWATENLTPGSHVTALTWRRDDLSFELTNPGQDKISFEFWRSFHLDPWEGPSHNTRGATDKNGFRATGWTFPSSMALTFHYADCAQASECTGFQDVRLTRVENNIGRFLEFEGGVRNPTSVKDDANRTISLTNTEVTHVDGKVTQYTFDLTTNGSFLGRPPTYVDAYLTAVREPGYANDNHKFVYDGADKIEHYENALGNRWLYQIGGGRRGAIVNPLGDTSVDYFDADGNTIRSIDGVGNETLAEFDGLGRLTERELPEGNKLRVAYDQNSNATRVDQISKNGSSTLTVTASFDLTYNVPTSVTDARGNTTTITLWPSTSGSKKGKVRFVDQPDVTGDWAYDYDSRGRLISATNPEGEVQEASYGTKGVFEGITADPGGFNLVTAITSHDAMGNPLTVNGPRTSVNDVVTMTYDPARRPLTVTDPLGHQSETHYNARGQAVKQCVQATTAAPTLSCAAATWSSPGGWQVTEMTYTETGQEESTRSPDGHVATTFYDAADRPLVTVDAEGRKTRTIYDDAGRVFALIKGWTGTNDGVGELDCDAMRAATASAPQTALQL